MQSMHIVIFTFVVIQCNEKKRKDQNKSAQKRQQEETTTRRQREDWKRATNTPTERTVTRRNTEKNRLCKRKQ